MLYLLRCGTLKVRLVGMPFAELSTMLTEGEITQAKDSFLITTV